MRHRPKRPLRLLSLGMQTRQSSPVATYFRADSIQRGGRDKGGAMFKVVGVAFNPGDSEYW